MNMYNHEFINIQHVYDMFFIKVIVFKKNFCIPTLTLIGNYNLSFNFLPFIYAKRDHYNI